MQELRSILSLYPIRTRLSLSGPMIVARDIAHAKIKERLDRGEGLPQYMKDHIVYYAGPAKTPPGFASGSFGPTTAGRMDSYVELFQSNGGSLVMLAKGNRSVAVTESCYGTVVFTWGVLADLRRGWPKNALRKSRLLNTPS